MKKFICRLVCLLTVCALFALPAFATEANPGSDALRQAEEYEASGDYRRAISAYENAAWHYENDGLRRDAGSAREAIGELYDHLREYEKAAGQYIKSAENYEIAKKYSWAARARSEAAEAYENISDHKNAAAQYLAAAEDYELCSNTAKAEKMRGYAERLNAKDGGSVVSEGRMTVIVGIAAAVVFGTGGFLLGRKERKKAK